MPVTHESRGALARAAFFLDKAKACPLDAREDFEAFLEASIIFARAAVHRFKTKHDGHPSWKAVWDAWSDEPAVEFFRQERDWILKEAPPKIGQKLFAPSVGTNTTAYAPSSAAEFYYYYDPGTPATATVEAHLVALRGLLGKAEQVFKP
jgi:hypothetical protein